MGSTEVVMCSSTTQWLRKVRESKSETF